MKTDNNTIIISGASITNDSAWPTWATWINRRYNFKNFINVSEKGMGNELIFMKAVHKAFKHPNNNLTIVVQLTNVDKWDWYIQDTNLVEIINKEKHPVLLLDNKDKHGFWSTGSHFPLMKEYFKEHYFSVEYQLFRTLQQIQWFQLLCKQKGWNQIILFDSPILSVLESQINTGSLSETQCVEEFLITGTLVRTVYETLDFSNIYKPGLIGFACLNKLPWYTKRFKGHPGSLTHYYYAKDIVSKQLDKIFNPVNDFDEFFHEAVKYQELIDV